VLTLPPNAAPNGALPEDRIHFFDSIPFWLVHVACLAVFLTGVSWVALFVCFVTYAARAFGITGGYHRYLAHRTFKTSRAGQFVLTVLGTAAIQKGPLWWAGHHRHHHRYTDTPLDIHSPTQRGFWWSHVGWILSRRFETTPTEVIRDFARFPEMRFLDRYHVVPGVVLGFAMFGLGVLLNYLAPGLGTSGWQMLVWGFFVSTVLLWHATFGINSIAHVVGSRRFLTKDTSRNNLILSLLTLGEGWHNNHHRYPGSERQGFYWWEIDITHYVLLLLSWVGIVWDLRSPPPSIYAEAVRTRAAMAAAGLR